MGLEPLQEKLGYQFSDRAILLQACTHTSFGHENLSSKPIGLRDNERLEFLGDAVLDLILTDILLESFPAAREGQLSKMRAAIVNESTLAEIALNIGLAPCMRLGKGELQSGGAEKPSIISSALEAVIAAIYLDGGFHAAYPVVRHLFAPFFNETDSTPFQDFKTTLQETTQAHLKLTPIYDLKDSYGPDHDKVFEVEVRIESKIIGRAIGTSKKQAEQKAAEMAMKTLDFEKEAEEYFTELEKRSRQPDQEQ